MSNSPQRRSIETMRERGDDFAERGRKAHHDKIGPSEQNFKRIIMEKLGVDDSHIVHGSGGFPDWVVLTNDFRLFGYEIKPIGTGKPSRLNDLQYKIAQLLLSSGAFTLFLVRYSGAGEDIRYDHEMELTLENLTSFCG